MSGCGGYAVGSLAGQYVREAKDMIIDIAKKYATRDRRKVVVISTSGPDSVYPVVVAMQNKFSGWDYDSVTTGGLSLSGNETNDDLIEVKPKPYTVRRVIEYTGTKESVNAVIGGYAPSRLGDVTVLEHREVVK